MKHEEIPKNHAINQIKEIPQYIEKMCENTEITALS